MPSCRFRKTNLLSDQFSTCWRKATPMIPNRMITIVSCGLIFVILAFVFVPNAQAQNDAPTAINGVYIGEFMRSGSANMKLKFSIKSTEDGSLTALFTFDL